MAYALREESRSGIGFFDPFMLLVNAGVFVGEFISFRIVKAIRTRQGIDINLAVAEIPPE